MIKIDCLGEMCPLPVLRAQETLKKLKVGESLLIVTDHSCVTQSLLEKYSKNSLIEIVEPLSGIWEIKITKP